MKKHILQSALANESQRVQYILLWKCFVGGRWNHYLLYPVQSGKKILDGFRSVWIGLLEMHPPVCRTEVHCILQHNSEDKGFGSYLIDTHQIQIEV